MSDQTRKNLKEAFAGESQARQRYTGFSAKAAAEGFANISRLFSVVAEAESIHAEAHLQALGQVKSTLENVQEAIKGESEEVLGMYPMFLDQAKRDANNEALNSFFWAMEAEKTHQALFEKAAEALKNGQDLELGDLYVCKVCGYTVEGAPPAVCPTCQKGREEFVKLG